VEFRNISHWPIKMSQLRDDNARMLRNKVHYYSYLSNGGKNTQLSVPVNKFTEKGSSFCTIAVSPLVFQNYASFYGEIDPKDIDICMDAARKAGVTLMAGSDLKNKQYLSDRGFLSIGTGNTMIFQIPSDKKPNPLHVDYEFASVESDSDKHDEDLKNWLVVFSKSFGFITSDVPFYTKLFGNVKVGRGYPLRLLSIKEKATGNIVSVGALFCDSDVAGVYNMATLESHRGKKLAECMLNHMIFDVGRDEMKMTVSMLQGAPKAVPLYKRFGFQPTDSGVASIYTGGSPHYIRSLGFLFGLYMNNKPAFFGIVAFLLAFLAYIVWAIKQRLF
jgi:hypothetical protein